MAEEAVRGQVRSHESRPQAAAASDASIERAVVSPGHDGSAELIVYIRYANGGRGQVCLDADAAERLFDRCGAERLEQLVGQPWQHLMHVLE